MKNLLVTAEKEQAVQKYIRAIRNAAKREYAQNYFDWIQNNFNTVAPVANFKELSLSTQQVVRTILTELLR